VASGAHATTLHWTRNDGVLGRDALVLVDAGAESHSLYSADLTRTYPVGGRYTDVQRRVLELLNDVHEVALAAVRPGSKFHDFRTAAAEAMGEALADWGIIPSSISAEEAQRRFTICGPGHMLGLDVHDCAAARAAHYLDGVLEEGHVLTVEPGLYFQADDVSIPAELRGLGARVEDDVVVTSDGITNLSEALPRRPQAVEEWLAALREA
jgi:Xaa-Pro aminopeptidase